mgnify:CR=1 FL=1
MIGKNRVFNTDLINLLKSKKINTDDALTYLLSLYYEIKPSYIPQKLESAILALNIVNKNYSSNELISSKQHLEPNLFPPAMLPRLLSIELHS